MLFWAVCNFKHNNLFYSRPENLLFNLLDHFKPVIQQSGIFFILPFNIMPCFHNINKIMTPVELPLYFQGILSKFWNHWQPEVKCYKIALHFIATSFPLLRRFKCLRICWKENPQSFHILWTILKYHFLLGSCVHTDSLAPRLPWRLIYFLQCLLFMENLTPQPSPVGVLISRMLIMKAKPYTILKGKNSSPGKGNFVFSCLVYCFHSSLSSICGWTEH